jgi:hypothetical protein
VEDCSKACVDEPTCLQAVFDGETCYLEASVREGRAKDPERGHKWQSVWNKTRIYDWIADHGNCSEIVFPPQF